MWSASSPYSTHVPGIEQQVEPLADGELAERALALDALGAAHAERPLPPLREVADAAAPSRARRHRPCSLFLPVAVASSGSCSGGRQSRRLRGHPRTASTCHSPGTPLSSPQRDDTGTDVDRDPGEVVATDLALARVGTTADLDAESVGLGRNGLRAADGAHRTVERGEEAVAGRPPRRPAASSRRSVKSTVLNTRSTSLTTWSPARNSSACSKSWWTLSAPGAPGISIKRAPGMRSAM